MSESSSSVLFDKEENGLPDGWEIAKIADLASKVGSGATPKGGKHSYKEEGTPLIRSMNVRMEGFKRKGLAFIDDAQADGLRAAEVEAEDVLLNITGASIGRVTVAPTDMDGARVNQHVCIIRPREYSVQPRFLSYFLAAPKQQSMIMRRQVGATRQALTKGMILDFDIPVPPLNEQKRIVAKIEELFSDLDAGVAALERARANLRRYRASVLKSAVEGRLTAEWRKSHPVRSTGFSRKEPPKDSNLKDKAKNRLKAGLQTIEPASKLLDRILHERCQRWEQQQLETYESKGKKPPKNWRDKYKPPADPDTTNLPELPTGWCWATVDQLTYYLRNGLSKKPSQTPPGHRILRINAVRPMLLDQNEVRYYEQDGVDDYFIDSGDLLLRSNYE